ncbi:MAG: hypothetical protein J6Y78_00985 [Paludibacteraceae bacterium]|nr:hypothetical protein [Paludibacteraceae bacterium]
MTNISMIRARLCMPLVLASMAFFNSCDVEEYDLSNVTSDMMMTETALDAPLGRVNVTMENVFLQKSANGAINTKDSVYHVEEYKLGDKLPFPMMATNIDIKSSDTLKKVGFDDVFGVYAPIDSVERVSIKFNVINQLPVRADLSMSFFKRTKKDKDSKIYTLTEITSLRRSISIAGSEVDPVTRQLYTANYAVEKFEFSGPECQELKDVTDIVVYYKLKSNDGEYYYLEKDYALQVSLSVYMKAKLYFNID